MRRGAGAPPTIRPLLAFRADGEVVWSTDGAPLAHPVSCYRLCVSNKFSHFRQKTREEEAPQKSSFPQTLVSTAFSTCSALTLFFSLQKKLKHPTTLYSAFFALWHSFYIEIEIDKAYKRLHFSLPI